MMDLLLLFLMFAQIGLFTIGGGMAMLPLIQKQLCDQGFMTLQEAVDMVAVSQMTPGPFAVNAATFVGMRMYGVPGAAAATLGVVLPSLVLTLIVARFFIHFHQKPLVGGALYGVRPVVMGLILSAALSVAKETLFPAGLQVMPDLLTVGLVAAALVLLLTVKKISPIGLIVACGVIGGFFLQGNIN